VQRSSAVGVAIFIAAALVLGVVGAGARAAPVLADSTRPDITMAAAPVSDSSLPTAGPSYPAQPRSQPEPAVEPGRTAEPTQQAQQAAADPKVPKSGPGRFVLAEITGPPAGSGTVVSFDVRRERNLPVNVNETARTIQSVLNDNRSWRGGGQWEFQLVRSLKRADLHVYIATPTTTDQLCAPLLTRGEVSCQNGNRIILNAKRWVFGADSYRGDVANYRRYLVNHEFGHALGYQHTECAGNGKIAGVMMQQTKGLDGCRANPWPYPAN
jgi:Protein of unknown function (DUF3152)